ncbi:MAG: FG-GAP repeat protein, partial [Euryarchaeota archaeon]|nr:FG-GAP repeat protein [Euryarchaeota archaeon]
TANDGEAHDLFGASVSISGDCAVVGAYGADDAGNNSGSAYIFKRDGTAWAQEAKITANDGEAHDLFGASVSISGDCAVVGAWKDCDAGPLSGSAYIFKRDGTAWAQEAKITANDGAAYDCFGASVAISGDRAIAGAWEDDDDGAGSGSAYIFKRDGTAWAQEAKITANDGAAHDRFGASVAISGDCAVVGAWRGGDGGPWSGSAYIFTRDGTTWTEQAKITANDGAAYDCFGASVAISSDCMVVGADHKDDADTNSGSAYIYDIPIRISSCDSDGNPQDQFAEGATVYVTGTNLPASTGYKLWIQDEAVSVGDALAAGEDPSGAQELVSTDAGGTLPVTAIWQIYPDATATHTRYDIVADNQAAGVVGTYHTSSDLLDSASTAGFVAPVPGMYALTTTDAVIALQIEVDGRPFDPYRDVSGDGRVTSLDALMIMQAAADAIEV